MQYEDRIPPEGANTPNRHPLRDFLKLSAMALIAVLVLGFVLNSVGGTLGGLMPFKYELWLAEKIEVIFEKSGQESPFEQVITHDELQEYLQSVTDRVTDAMGLEESMPITLHYNDEDTINAYATIGGHVYFFEGLLSMLPHENALTMLMAHEISHISLRHTAKGLGSGLMMAIGTAMVGVASENELVGLGATLSSTRFSRDMESQADLVALEVVNKMYGHVGGAQALFEVFSQQIEGRSNEKYEVFLSTHPLDEQRIARVKEIATERMWQLEGETTPLPDQFSEWLR